jgi:hypothetical protein
MLSFIVFTMVLITITQGYGRHPYTSEGLLQLITWQTIALGIMLLCMVGVYLTNTYEIKRIRRR